jgi:hypothetical protein
MNETDHLVYGSNGVFSTLSMNSTPLGSCCCRQRAFALGFGVCWYRGVPAATATATATAVSTSRYVQQPRLLKPSRSPLLKRVASPRTRAPRLPETDARPGIWQVNTLRANAATDDDTDDDDSNPNPDEPAMAGAAASSSAAEPPPQESTAEDSSTFHRRGRPRRSERCPGCLARGKLRCDRCAGSGHMGGVRCEVCFGFGKTRCSQCGGTGFILKEGD